MPVAAWMMWCYMSTHQVAQGFLSPSRRQTKRFCSGVICVRNLCYHIWCPSADIRNSAGVSDFKQIGGRTAVMHLPPFHTMGICTQLYVPLFDLVPACVYPPTSFENHAEPPIMPTSENIVEHSKRTKATSCMTVPTFIELWNTVPEHIEWLRSLTHVVSLYKGSYY